MRHPKRCPMARPAGNLHATNGHSATSWKSSASRCQPPAQNALHYLAQQDEASHMEALILTESSGEKRQHLTFELCQDHRSERTLETTPFGDIWSMLQETARRPILGVPPAGSQGFIVSQGTQLRFYKAVELYPTTISCLVHCAETKQNSPLNLSAIGGVLAILLGLTQANSDIVSLFTNGAAYI
ncbi:uncharacterized protein CLUP02_06828 [Colletotrichum lupini]|uniref:Uncharacterized protein n=1 Tax=Colletotrichum lupini TaxID=145971 RepID=A0A9Q8SPV3_9PEZI|nr:uncharacterized protein CLUP02_06828 [Colletotrichum lupini]UQC81342.1 hypothetical protein CLUP02_06828 [Colletotrichum lupini]